MFEEGKENSVLKQIWSKMPQKVTESSCGLDSANIKEILPANKAYYRFSGSLTTPPCSEGVRWFVMQEYSHISKSQVEKFAKIVHGHNNRDVLELNARKVIK